MRAPLGLYCWTFLWSQLLVLIPFKVHASVGDRSLAYQQCTASCQDACFAGDRPHLSLPLRSTFWTCQDDCSYECTHDLTNLALANDLSLQDKMNRLPGLPPNRVVQFHGKWPFYRFLGMQEPLSILFSIGNLYMHVKYGLNMAKRLPPNLPKPLQTGLRTLPVAGINLWIWSIVFHTRDKPWTERLDYFSAALSMLCNLYVAILRLSGLYRDRHVQLFRSTQNARALLACGLGLVFLAHVIYLSCWRFDYSYNMAFNVCIGLLHNVLWSSWSFYHLIKSRPASRSGKNAGNVQGSSRPSHYLRPFLILTLLSSLTALELLDFPPILRSLDAHALWHTSTIPVIKWWYDCLVEDAWWLAGDRLTTETRRKA